MSCRQRYERERSHFLLYSSLGSISTKKRKTKKCLGEFFFFCLSIIITVAPSKPQALSIQYNSHFQVKSIAKSVTKKSILALSYGPDTIHLYYRFRYSYFLTNFNILKRLCGLCFDDGRIWGPLINSFFLKFID